MKFVLFLILLMSLSGCTVVRGLFHRVTNRVETIQCEQVVEVVPPGKSDRERVAFIGDFGTGKKKQRQVANSLAKFHQKKPFDFVIGVGDNFYPYGVDSSDDPRFQTDFEQIYQGLEIPFYMALGNHDHLLSPRAQIKYQSKRWKMPCAYYGIQGRGYRIFTLDTPQIIDGAETLNSQLQQMEDFLCNYDGLKIVSGHHPLVSPEEKDRTGQQADLRQALLSRMKKCGVELYLAGHSHLLAHDQVEGIDQFISGAAGKKQSCQKNRLSPSRFCHGGYGFATLEFSSPKKVTVGFFDEHNQSIYSWSNQ